MREKRPKAPKPAVPPQPVMREPRTIVPEEERVDLSFLERMEFLG